MRQRPTTLRNTTVSTRWYYLRPPLDQRQSIGTMAAGYIDLAEDFHSAVDAATLQSVAAQGFQQIVIWRGCSGHKLTK